MLFFKFTIEESDRNGGKPKWKKTSIQEESNWIQSSPSLKEKAEKYISLHML